MQSILDPSGVGAALVGDLWWVLFWTLGGVMALVVVLLAWALFRRRDGDAPKKPSVTLWIGVGGIALPVVVLSVLHGFTLRAMSGQSAQAEATQDDLVIRVVGHRWWWEVEYDHPEPGRSFTTANEIRIPVDRPVEVELESRDVIHSFWVPRLQGKMDLIPGRTNTTWLQADEPGVYRGQCAEYCGLQHANMGFLVVAQPLEAFEEWYDRQLQPAAEPADSLEEEGRRTFMEKPCAVCHTVRGTLAQGRVAPELTHLASRRTLAAGIIPNTRGYLGGWISNPQGIKPGSLMPNIDLSAGEMQALLAYLESLE